MSYIQILHFQALLLKMLHESNRRLNETIGIRYDDLKKMNLYLMMSPMLWKKFKNRSDY